ncbi:hemolysin-type calcium-binding region [Vibrio astriarenae]|nr:hemolysin-type calcium-binding region [Vibrio sp. C7]
MFTKIYEELTASLADPNLIELTDGDDELNLTGDDLNVVNAQFGNDVISGGENTDIIFGRGGDDVISGGAGDDILVGGLGADRLSGASGNDILVGRTDDTMIAGGKGFDALYLAAGEDDGFFDYVTQARGIEAIVAYGEEDVSARVSLSSIKGQSQDDGNEDTPDIDDTFIAVGLESLSLIGVNKFMDGDELAFSVEDIDGQKEQDYLDMLNLTIFSELNTDLKAITFGSEEYNVTIITDLDLDDITAFDGVSLEDMSMDA